MKDGEGINQRTFRHSPWTQTKMWVLTWSGERVTLEKEKGRKVGTAMLTA